jgi:hypothetical protein
MAAATRNIPPTVPGARNRPATAAPSNFEGGPKVAPSRGGYIEAYVRYEHEGARHDRPWFCRHWLQASLMAAALGGLAATGRWALRTEEADPDTLQAAPSRESTREPRTQHRQL